MAIHATDSRTGARPAHLADTGLAMRAWAATFDRVHVDIGTGDGAFALRLARRQPDTAVIALDTNLDRLRGSQRRYPENVRFVTADAIEWPLGMLPAAGTVTINFPYGSLLRALVAGNRDLAHRLDALLDPIGEARLTVRVNRTAFLATGLDPRRGPEAIAAELRRLDGACVMRRSMARDELRAFPSTWAKRLGHGREAGATRIDATRVLDAGAGVRVGGTCAP